MPPNLKSTPTGVLFENDSVDTKEVQSLAASEQNEETTGYFKTKIVWRNVVIFGYLHFAAVYGAYLLLTQAKIYTVIWAILTYLATGLGITAGAHRLWAHKAYKAKWPLKLILIIFNTMAFQNSVFEWSRDHRVHHKFSETDGDPHNAKRGFFFSHVGWLLMKKHKDVIEKGKTIDLSDLEQDKFVMFQKKYYLILMPLICFILPTLIPMYFWGETIFNAWFGATMFRYVFTLNVTWLVNSAAHMWGGKPYDQYINPSENVGVSLLALGEGWHNYHHVFPWDYKTAELGNYRTNYTTGFIDFMSRIGWAYDLKTVPVSLVQRRAERTGDGSHPVWGWGDKDMETEEMEDAIRIKKAD